MQGQAFSGGIRRFLLFGAGVTTLWSVVGILLGLTAQGVLARNLEKHEVATFFLLVSLEAFIILVLSLGVDRYCIRVISGRTQDPDQVSPFSTIVKALSVNLFCGSLFIPIFALWIFPHFQQSVGLSVDQNVVVVIGLWYVSSTFSTIAAECFRGLRRLGLSGLLGGGVLRQTLLLTSVLLWVQFRAHISIDVVIWILASIMALQGFGFMAYALLLIRRIPGKGAHAIGKVLLVGLPIAGVAMISWGNREFDLWIVGFLLDPDELALYGAAMRLNRLVSFSAMIVNAVLPPLIVSLYAEKKLDDLQEIMRAMITVSTLLAVLVLLTYLVVGKFIISLVYGPAYIEAYSILLVLALGKALGVMAGAGGLVLLFTDREKLMFRLMVGVLTANILLQVTFTYFFGVMGTASAAATIMLLQNVLFAVAIRRELGISISVPRNPSAAAKNVWNILLSRTPGN